MRGNSRNFLYIFMLCWGLFSCASRQKALPTAENVTPAPQAPSPLDPKAPPRVFIEGLKRDELLKQAREVTVRVEGYPMAPDWQGVEVALNDSSPQRFFEPTFTFTVTPDQLRKGANLIKVYLVRSWGESLKIPEAFSFVPFFYETKEGLSWVAPQRPILTLVSPRGSYKGEDAKKILFDFMVQNPERQSKVYKVHYTLNGKKLGLESGQSYYFYNLTPGSYELRVEVVNERGIPLGQEVTRSRALFKVEAEN